MIPSHIKAKIDRHVEFGEPGGKFVDSVLENNLVLAVGYADDQSIKHIRDIVQYCFSVCHRMAGNKTKGNVSVLMYFYSLTVSHL